MVQADNIAKAVGIELRTTRQWTSNSTAELPEQDGGGVLLCRNLHPIHGLHNQVITGTRHAPYNKNHFALFSLHPVLMSQLDRNSF